MKARFLSSMKPSSAGGFTLVELLVALALTGILMTGMAQIFKSTVSSFYQSGDTLSAQRRNRWALGQLEDDLRMIGHTDGLINLPTGVTQAPFRIVPGGTTTAPLDSIEFFCNLPVEESEVAAEIPAGSSTMTLRPVGKSNFLAQAGDWFFLRDGMHSEKGFFAGPVVPAGEGLGTATLMSQEEAQTMPRALAGLMEVPAPLFKYSHGTHKTLMVLRPMQIVQYSIRTVNIDPDPTAEAVPCLIRRQADYMPTGSDIVWDSLSYTVVADNVSSLKIDLSVNGGVNWTRSEGANWDAMVTSANTGLPATNRVDNSSFWFKRIPILLKVDLRTRSATQRAEYSLTGQALAHKERSMVLMIAPRNCGLP